MSGIGRFRDTVYVGAYALLDRTVPRWPARWIETAQRLRLRSIVRYAHRWVPFYRDAMRESGLRPDDFHSVEDLARLPLLDSTMVRSQLDRFTSQEFDDRQRLVHHSGSGQVVYWDERASLRKLAHAERDRVVLGRLVGKMWGQRQVYLVPPDSSIRKKRALWEGRVWFTRWMAQRHFLSTDLVLEEVAEQIDTLRPDVVFSYGSYADQFFRFVLDRGLRIALPRVWVYGGDMLAPGSKALIEENFDCLVYSTYQAVETSRLGFQCERREGFHLNVDLCAVRVVDDQGRSVPPGESGELVVSNLYNRAVVLLNYRLGDRGAIAPSGCACGRRLPLLERFEGRCSELIRLSDGREVSALLLVVTSQADLAATLRNQLVQVAPGHIRWLIVPFSGVDREGLRSRLEAQARRVLGQDARVDVKYVDHIPTNLQGKLQHIGWRTDPLTGAPNGCG